MTPPIRTVGVLSAGGDAPGINAAICGLGRRLLERGVTVLGFTHGWRGLILDQARPLTVLAMHDLLVAGGSVLGCSSHDPYLRGDRHDVERIRATFAARKLDALVAIGGDGTFASAVRLWREEGLPIVGVPKTIDNDLSGTDYTFGFVTAVERACQAMDQLRTTADSHDRVLVVECMGRHAGWITAFAGVAAGAESVLVPERPVELQHLFASLEALRRAGRKSAIVAAAEGIRLFEGGKPLSPEAKDEYGRYRTGGVAELVAKRIQAVLGWEARAQVLGYMQRAGSALAIDRIFALRLGAKAARLVLERRFGRMSALRGGEVTDVAFEEAVAKTKNMSDVFLDRYSDFFLPLDHP
jgi:6-phosphofructokinase 1